MTFNKKGISSSVLHQTASKFVQFQIGTSLIVNMSLKQQITVKIDTNNFLQILSRIKDKKSILSLRVSKELTKLQMVTVNTNDISS